MSSQLRYDPLYRVIDEVEELNKIEGYYRDVFDRLKNISNLGIIPRVLEMANYPKYEHSVGTVHQIHKLLELADNQSIPKKYRFPLRLASIFLHTGHLPFTFSSERSLLLACNLGDRTQKNQVEKYIRKCLKSVFKVWDIDSSRREEVVEDMLSMNTCKLLYRFMSAYILIECWGRIKNKLGLKDSDLRTAVQDLVDEGNDGFQWLTLASKADYVQRDALYLGTVRIDISPRHLYGDLSEYSPKFSVNEEKLIEANLRYLKDRFYDDLNVVWFSRLYEKIAARFLISGKIKPKWLREYNDSQLERLMKDGRDPDGNRIRLSPKWRGRAKKLFEKEFEYKEVLSINNFIYPKDVIDLEYDLVGKRHSQKGLLEYPFDQGIILSLEYVQDEPFSFNGEVRLPAPPDHSAYEVRLFRASSSKRILETLRVIERLSDRASLQHHEKLRAALSEELSWTGEARIDNNDVVAGIGKAIGEVESDSEGFIESFVRELIKIKTYMGIWNNHENILWRFQATGSRPDVGEDRYKKYCQYVARGVLSLPVRLLQYKETRSCLDKIYDKLDEIFLDGDSDLRRGTYLRLCVWLIVLGIKGMGSSFL